MKIMKDMKKEERQAVGFGGRKFVGCDACGAGLAVGGKNGYAYHSSRAKFSLIIV